MISWVTNWGVPIAVIACTEDVITLRDETEALAFHAPIQAKRILLGMRATEEKMR